MSFLQIKNLSFEYSSYSEETQGQVLFKALDNIDLTIEKGSFVAILGHNGSGKSTLAKHFSGILTGTSGEVIVNNRSTSKEENIWDIKKDVGIVFQNPDNQIVASIVEDDIAFGVENLGLPREEIKERINFALESVGMSEFRDATINNLSGGQKQRVAIAGILAMQPQCIVLDEPTAMLDPSGRKEIINIIKKLNKQKNITIILITHFMEEVVDAERLVVMEKGRVILDDTPLEVFKNIDYIKKIKLDVPEGLDIAHSLNKLGHNLPLDSLTLEGFAKNLIKYGLENNLINELNLDTQEEKEKVDNPNLEKLKLKNITHTYSEGTVFERTALSDINLTINHGDFLGIIGHTGSGKSTLIQMLNALIKPSQGDIYLNRVNMYDFSKSSNNKKTNKKLKNINLREIRKKVGVVFQYPEYQLFEETVYKDVAYAPNNMNLPKEEVDKRVIEALNIVSIGENYYNKSPFELSGGEKRRVAIAGIIAMRPDILVFDELTAGLDPFTREEVLSQIIKMQNDLNLTIVLVSHSMEDVAKVCNRIIVLNKGKCILNNNIENVFKNNELLEEIGLDVPKYSKLFEIINKEYGYGFSTNVYKLKDCVKILDNNLKNNKNNKNNKNIVEEV
ncbi:MAG: energy-coupling factor transporter ATPase [bacterium]